MKIQALIYEFMIVNGVMNLAAAKNLSLKNDDGKIALLAKALYDALQKSEILEVNLIIGKSLEAKDLLDNFFQLSRRNLILNLGELTVKKSASKSSAILFLENENSFEENFVLHMTKNHFCSKGKFFLLAFDRENLNMTKIFLTFWKFNAFNANIILVKNDSIEMITFEPFSINKCQNFSPMKINTFDGKAWKETKIFPNKFKNLYQCPIKLSTFDYPPAIIVDKRLITGHEIELLEEISKMINFKLEINVLNEPAAWGFLMENGTSGGVMKKILNKEADIGIGVYYLTQTRVKFMSYSEYGSSKLVLMIPPGKPLAALEKLLSPFRKFTWICLLLTFMIAVLIIAVVRRQKKSVKHFVFGVKTGNPYLNLFGILMNGSQHFAPKNNFARTLLMIFIIFCIVIRTLYQAALFHFLQTDQRKAEVQTIDEIIAENFDVYMYDSFLELSQGLKIHQR